MSMLALVSLNYRVCACPHLFRLAVMVRWIDVKVPQRRELGNTIVAIATLPREAFGPVHKHAGASCVLRAGAREWKRS